MRGREQPESKLRRKVKADLKLLPHAWFVKIQQVAIIGTPDFLGCLNGRFVALELKRAANIKPAVIQTHILQLIEKAGGITFVVHPANWSEVYAKLEKLSTTRLYYI